MRKFKETDSIPWKSFGRVTPTLELSRSLLPVGGLPFNPKDFPIQDGKILGVSNADESYRKFVMEICGTAFQAGRGKYVTCAHVVDALSQFDNQHILHCAHMDSGDIVYSPFVINKKLRYIDPRHDKQNPNVDLALLLSVPLDMPGVPYRVPDISWGDSATLGVGDRVCVGGYPLGTSLFFMTASNRGIIQPTFYDGIVSAILPATSDTETRLIQVSIPVCGGISGGVLFTPEDGKVYGMVTSGVTAPGDIPLPMTYAIPSEVIQPFVDAVTFKTKSEMDTK